jgi:hypothetical protein
MLVHVNGLGITCIEPEEGHLIKHIESGRLYKKVFLNKKDSVENYKQVVDVNYEPDMSKVRTIEVDPQLPVAKKEMVELSKSLLAAYLMNNPLKSIVKHEDGRFYNVTLEKQNLLHSNIVAYQVAQQVGMEYPLMWNSVGDVMEPWTIEEILKLSIEIRDYVSPLVAQQQEIEKAINKCRSTEELQEINIEFKK